MKRKKAYVSPQVMRVKLEPTQAVLSQCSIGITGLSETIPGGCHIASACKQKEHGGDTASTS